MPKAVQNRSGSGWEQARATMVVFYDAGYRAHRGSCSTNTRSSKLDSPKVTGPQAEGGNRPGQAGIGSQASFLPALSNLR